MGADLYINSLYEPCKAKHEKAFHYWVRVRDALSERADEHPRCRDLSERAQKLVVKHFDGMYAEGYFCDSYNATNLLWACGLSWSEDCPFNKKDGVLRGARLKAFRKLVAEHPPQEQTYEALCERNAHVKRNGPHGVKEWNRYFREKHARLLAFLDTAIELKEGVYCSV